MIGKYWSTGIIVSQQYPGNHNSWIAKVEFQDDSHAQIGGIKGTLSTKYQTSLLDCIRTVYEDAQALGIEFRSIPGKKPSLYVEEFIADTKEAIRQVEVIANETGLDVVN